MLVQACTISRSVKENVQDINSRKEKHSDQRNEIRKCVSMIYLSRMWRKIWKGRQDGTCRLWKKVAGFAKSE